jgi:hypothetical protein
MPRSHVKWVPFHHDMTSEVADGGDGLHIWTVVTYMLNTQSWTVDKG